MDVRKWFNSGSRTISLLAHCFYGTAPVNSPSSSASTFKLRWKLVLRMRSKKEKRKMFLVSYDPYTYSQNFDQGFAWDAEPDNFSRSFSVRFADPSKVFMYRTEV